MSARRQNTRTSVAASAAALLLAAVVLGACGGGNARSTSADEPVDVERGRQLFQSSCRACHSLADADAAGVFGPDLDQLKPDLERIREQIDSGGGGMPADILSARDAETVARYVATVAGAAPSAEGDPAAPRDRGSVVDENP